MCSFIDQFNKILDVWDFAFSVQRPTNIKIRIFLEAHLKETNHNTYLILYRYIF